MLEHTQCTTSLTAPLNASAILSANLWTWLHPYKQMASFGATCCLLRRTATRTSIRKMRVRIIILLRWAYCIAYVERFHADGKLWCDYISCLLRSTATRRSRRKMRIRIIRELKQRGRQRQQLHLKTIHLMSKNNGPARAFRYFGWLW